MVNAVKCNLVINLTLGPWSAITNATQVGNSRLQISEGSKTLTALELKQILLFYLIQDQISKLCRSIIYSIKFRKRIICVFDWRVKKTYNTIVRKSCMEEMHKLSREGRTFCPYSWNCGSRSAGSVRHKSSSLQAETHAGLFWLITPFPAVHDGFILTMWLLKERKNNNIMEQSGQNHK